MKDILPRIVEDLIALQEEIAILRSRSLREGGLSEEESIFLSLLSLQAQQTIATIKALLPILAP